MENVGADPGPDNSVFFRSKSCLTLENGRLVRAVLFRGCGINAKTQSVNLLIDN